MLVYQNIDGWVISLSYKIDLYIVILMEMHWKWWLLTDIEEKRKKFLSTKATSLTSDKSKNFGVS